jgi:hypothetical protein
MTLTIDEARLVASLLRPQLALLSELLEVQVQLCPPGDDSWCITAEALAVARGAWIKAQNTLLVAS